MSVRRDIPHLAAVPDSGHSEATFRRGVERLEMGQWQEALDNIAAAWHIAVTTGERMQRDDADALLRDVTGWQWDPPEGAA